MFGFVVLPQDVEQQSETAAGSRYPKVLVALQVAWREFMPAKVPFEYRIVCEERSGMRLFLKAER